MNTASKCRGFALACVCLLLALAIPAAADIIYVMQGSGFDGPGNDWDHAYHAISTAVLHSVEGDEIRVAGGVYEEPVLLKSGVRLLGGYAGTDDTRDPKTYISTIRSGSDTIISPLGASSETVFDGFVVDGSGGWRIRCYSGSTIISNNVIGNPSGAISSGGGIRCEGSPSPTIRDNFLIANSYYNQYGGAISCDGATAAILNNIITRNYSPYGAGIYCVSSQPIIAGNRFIGNTAAQGGAIYCDASSAIINGNTIVANAATNAGGGLYVTGECAPLISNNIVAFNSSGIWSDFSSAPVLTSNLVYNPDGQDYEYISPGSGDISADPQLVSVGYGQVHLLPGSPCIDAGCNTCEGAQPVDMDGDPRIINGAIDIGADEYNGIPPESFVPTVVRVAKWGNDLNDGGSWERPMETIQTAVNKAALSGGEVWTAYGVYNEYVQVPPYVYIYGGFEGDENSIDERVPGFITEIDNLYDYSGWGIDFVDGGYRLGGLDRVSVLDSIEYWTSAGIQCERSSPLISDCSVTGILGNGIYCYASASIIEDCSISGSSNWGIFSNESSPTILRCSVFDNTQGGIGSQSSYVCRIRILDSAIYNNIGPGAYLYYCDPVEIVSNSISGNLGGGVQLNYSGGSVSNNFIVGNQTYGNGGGILADYSSLIYINNNVISGNTAYQYGGGISISRGEVTNNTIVRNNAGYGAGIYCGLDYWYYENASVCNNIVAFQPSGICSDGATPLLGNNCLFNSEGYDHYGLPPGPGDFRADPALANIDAGDYHLTSLSPCINAGWNTAPGMPFWDFDWESRIIGGIVDIGADEYSTPPEVPIMTMSEAKQSPDGTLLQLDEVVVTAADLEGHFYIEALNRSSGIAAYFPGHPQLRDILVQVVGTIRTVPPTPEGDWMHVGERYIDVVSVYTLGSGSVAPVALSNLALGGGDWQYDPATGAGQRGIAGATGLNNIGLLITAWGLVTYVDSVDEFFYMDDGSKIHDAYGLFTGVAVECPPDNLPSEGDYVRVTGISTCFGAYNSADSLCRAVLPRSPEDITVLKQAPGGDPPPSL